MLLFGEHWPCSLSRVSCSVGMGKMGMDHMGKMSMGMGDDEAEAVGGFDLTTQSGERQISAAKAECANLALN